MAPFQNGVQGLLSGSTCNEAASLALAASKCWLLTLKHGNQNGGPHDAQNGDHGYSSTCDVFFKMASLHHRLCVISSWVDAAHHGHRGRIVGELAIRSTHVRRQAVRAVARVPHVRCHIARIRCRSRVGAEITTTVVVLTVRGRVAGVGAIARDCAVGHRARRRCEVGKTGRVGVDEGPGVGQGWGAVVGGSDGWGVGITHGRSDLLLFLWVC